MSARNHVEAQQRRAPRPSRKRLETEMAIAGASVADAAAILLRRLRGSMDAGDLTISGSEDMAEAVRDGLDRLESATKVFEDISKGRPA